MRSSMVVGRIAGGSSACIECEESLRVSALCCVKTIVREFEPVGDGELWILLWMVCLHGEMAVLFDDILMLDPFLVPPRGEENVET